MIRFRRDFRLGLRIYDWIVIFTFNHKTHKVIGKEWSYSIAWNNRIEKLNRPW